MLDRRDLTSVLAYGFWSHENAVAHWELIGNGTTSTVAFQLTRNAISGFVPPSRKFVKRLLGTATDL
jgi:hypothetical protein